MSLTIANPYSATGKNSTTPKIRAFEVDASSDQVEISPLLTTTTRQPSVSEQTSVYSSSEQQEEQETRSIITRRQTVGEIPEDTPRSRQITSFLSHQAKTILEEKRKRGKRRTSVPTTTRRIQSSLLPSSSSSWWNNKNDNDDETTNPSWQEEQEQQQTIEKQQQRNNDHHQHDHDHQNLSSSSRLLRELLEIILDRMNKEIWQYERRNILTDIQSIALLLVASLFLYQFAGPIVRWSVFIIRRFSFPVACVYLVVPTLQDLEKETSSSEAAFDMDTTANTYTNKKKSRY